MALFIGALIGTTPLFGLHGLLAVGSATLLRINRIITLAASNYSVAPLYPFIAVASIQIGSLLTTGHVISISLASVGEIDPTQVGLSWVLGSLILGASIGSVLGTVGFFSALWLQRRRQIVPPSAVSPPDSAGKV